MIEVASYSSAAHITEIDALNDQNFHPYLEVADMALEFFKMCYCAPPVRQENFLRPWNLKI